MAFLKYEKYKDSGVEWLGEIPNHWTVKGLKRGFIFEKGKNSHILTNEYVEKHPGNYPVFSGQTENNGVLGYIDSFIYDLEKVIFVTTVGAKAMTPKLLSGKFSLSQNCLLMITLEKSLNFNYFYYQLFTIFPYEKKSISSHMQDSLRISDIKNFNALFPPLEEQKRIAAFLDSTTAEIDEAIAKKQRLIELLQEQKAILINQAVTKGLNPKAPMRDSGVEWIGEIPEHWEVKQLKRLFVEFDDCSVDGTETLLSLRMYEGLVPHTEVSDKPITSNDLIGYKRVKPGELVMNRMRAALGLFAVASTKGIVSPDYAIFRSLVDLIPDFYVHLFKTSKMKDIFFLESKGLGTGSAGFLRLYSDRFGWIKVPVPPVKEQVEIISHIKHITNEFMIVISKITDEISLLQELRNVTISNAVTGKIKI
ncbi:restriction endonuclease subunit S [Nostoc linckia FACHB-104]|nr:restriction endonuclease subunit S [Nostoc linckia FACHB-104]